MEDHRTENIKEAIRTKYAWPGGYELFGITTDGALLCTDCLQANFKTICEATKNRFRNGWNVPVIANASNLECRDSVEENADNYSLGEANATRLLNP